MSIEKMPQWATDMDVTAEAPSEERRKTGFVAGDRPSAGLFNWFWQTVIERINGLSDSDDALDRKLGDLSQLSTRDKESLVRAINDVSTRSIQEESYMINKVTSTGKTLDEMINDGLYYYTYDDSTYSNGNIEDFMILLVVSNERHGFGGADEKTIYQFKLDTNGIQTRTYTESQGQGQWSSWRSVYGSIDQLQTSLTYKADKQTANGGFVAGEGAEVSDPTSDYSSVAIGKESYASVSGAAIGFNTIAYSGGAAIGEKAYSNGGGGAIGNGASAAIGGAVGKSAKAGAGGAVGACAQTGEGFAGGMNANAESGGAVGDSAVAGNGFAGGYQADSRGPLGEDGEPQNYQFDAIQLGTGTNTNEKTLQVYDYTLMDASGKVPAARMPDEVQALCYDVVVRTQQEFDALVATDDWNGAQRVLFDASNVENSTFNVSSEIVIPPTVKVIHGAGGCYINLNQGDGYNFGYETLPESDEYELAWMEFSIRNKVQNCRNLWGCKGNFSNCNGMYNCIEVSSCQNCTNLYGCSVSGPASSCTNLYNCSALSYNNCTNLVGCTSRMPELDSGNTGVMATTDLFNIRKNPDAEAGDILSTHLTIGTRKNGAPMGARSIAVGESAQASSTNSCAFGYFSVAAGYSSFAACNGQAMASYAYAEGNNAKANGSVSHAEGYFTTADGDYQHVQGKYNAVDSTKAFIIGNGNASDRSNAFSVDWNGNSYAKTHSATGADYAELWEWADGNPEAQDRVGRFVAFDGSHIRFAASADPAAKLGVTSADPAVVGDNYEHHWKGKYVTDLFGRVQMEEVTVPALTQQVCAGQTQDGEDVMETIELVPEHTELQPVISPDYDPSLTYIPRKDRPEWAFVGTHGKLVVADDGTCAADGFCLPGADGIATAADNGFYVMERLDDSHIRIYMK